MVLTGGWRRERRSYPLTAKGLSPGEHLVDAAWRLSFELDNFNDAEIAYALTMFAGGVAFSRADVAACRDSARNPPGKVKFARLRCSTLS